MLFYFSFIAKDSLSEGGAQLLRDLLNCFRFNLFAYFFDKLCLHLAHKDVS